MIALVASLTIASAGGIAVRVEGTGYLRFALEGRVVYARAARIAISDGLVRHESGAPLLPSLSAPKDASALFVDSDGAVRFAGDSGSRPSGRILLARFDEGTPLEASGPFFLSKRRPILGYPGENGFGSIVAEARSHTSPPGRPEPARSSDTSRTRVSSSGSAEVGGESMLLGNLAKIEGQGATAESLRRLDLGPPPALGVVTLVTPERIHARSVSAGIKAADYELDIGSGIEVRRKGQSVPHARFVETAKAEIARLAGAVGLDCKEQAADFFAPAGELALKPENAKLLADGASVAVAVYVDGKRFNSRTIRLTGELPPDGVKAGEIVKVVFVTAGVAAEIEGRAKASARVGQPVGVSVSFAPGSLPTTHFGTVKSPGIVEVKL